MDPSDGSVLETIGQVGFGGPKDLAFVPEPSPTLLALSEVMALGTLARTQRAKRRA